MPRYLTVTQVLSSEVTLQQLLDKLASFLPKSDSPINEEISILMYFDEAHTLNVPSMSQQQSSLSHHHLLTKSLNKFNSFPIFSVFLSTNSNMSILSPPQRQHPSIRVSTNSNDSLQTPYTELPFDCSPDIKLAFKRGTMKIDEVNKFDWMCRFGRAL